MNHNFKYAAVQFWDDKGLIHIYIGKSYDEIIKDIKEESFINCYKRHHIDGFILHVGGLNNRFIDVEMATKIATRLQIPMKQDHLTPEDLWDSSAPVA